jgi:hypothetical protein
MQEDSKLKLKSVSEIPDMESDISKLGFDLSNDNLWELETLRVKLS